MIWLLSPVWLVLALLVFYALYTQHERGELAITPVRFIKRLASSDGHIQ